MVHLVHGKMGGVGVGWAERQQLKAVKILLLNL